jgi:hypothetical protein
MEPLTPGWQNGALNWRMFAHARQLIPVCYFSTKLEAFGVFINRLYVHDGDWLHFCGLFTSACHKYYHHTTPASPVEAMDACRTYIALRITLGLRIK